MALDHLVDTKTYSKALRYAVGRGYSMRVAPPTSGVIHTTNNSTKGTSFDGEALFLCNSPDVSAHYLIGKIGQIVQFLDPTGFVAWHAGQSLAAFSNQASWGIEMHVSVGEQPTLEQLDALTWLCRTLMKRFGMIPAQIETHRAIALPKGRKSDPEGWTDLEFYSWRAQLLPPPTRRLRLRGWPIYQAQSLTGTLAGHLQAGETITIDKTYSNGAAHLGDARGFIDLHHDAFEELP